MLNGFVLTGGLAVAFARWGPVGLVAMCLRERPTNAWIYWLVLVQGRPPLTGRLPWSVQTLLADAYQRGVLLQTGTV